MQLWDRAVNSGEAKVLVLGATNRPQDLDKAILRRFERTVYVPLPSASARQSIFASHLEALMHTSPIDGSNGVGRSIDDQGEALKHAGSSPLLGFKPCIVNVDDVACQFIFGGNYQDDNYSNSGLPPALDYAGFALASKGFSCSDIVNVCREVARLVSEKARTDSGGTTRRNGPSDEVLLSRIPT
jgi:SpoVK/Ycf46/Vps4 family AAA+-type ATPase